MPPHLQVLIPVYKRSLALAATLTSVIYQNYNNFEILLSDQNEKYDLSSKSTILELKRILEFKGIKITFFKNLPRQGMAQQRQFLLEKSNTPYILYLDADVILESYVIDNLLTAIHSEKFGYVGQAVVSLKYKNDIRFDEHNIEFWEDKVIPEMIVPGSKKWQRYKLHNAANVLHVQEKLDIKPESPRLYKVAWVGGCVLFDRKKLIASGGFKFGDIPNVHSGEDVAAQLRVIKRYGGCGQLPSGVYHLDLPTTIPDRKYDLAKMIPF